MMTAAVSTTASEKAAAAAAKRLANLRPYKPGQSGSEVKSKRYLELHASIVGDLGVRNVSELSGIDRIAVEQIVQQLRRAERAKDHAEAARCSRTAQQWLKDLQGRRAKREPSGPPLREYLAKKAVEGTGL
jgi:hypothetical protein